MLASLMGCSFEAIVIDNDMLGAVQRVVRGIELSEDTLSFEVIREVCCGGPGHYLGQEQTLRIMESEYHYPQAADRSTADEWSEKGATDMRERAAKKAREILSSHYPRYIEPGVDEEIRRRHPIRLPREAMTSSCGRW